MGYAPTCQVTLCGEKSCVRLSDKENTRRRDLCLACAFVALNEWGDSLVIVDTWNGITEQNVLDGLETLKEMRSRG